jgi:hypothetical protein
MPSIGDIAASSSAASSADLGADISGDRIFRFGSKTVGGDPRYELATAVVIGLAAVAGLYFWTRR